MGGKDGPTTFHYKHYEITGHGEKQAAACEPPAARLAVVRWSFLLKKASDGDSAGAESHATSSSSTWSKTALSLMVSPRVGSPGLSDDGSLGKVG